ncbi:MFS transporter [Bailinhaonella thermotolerans]|uniref:MFS transporter n=1 Tax=Bailinhaonella thermotolerans TaxID=1070861 RepID=A0A3A4AXK6_9ACTN|nr:MFS transporter [Bailinhaonella thermotolerans]RJL32134.1 MFS transporter [Bailinhaonella thermotolerans]
MSFASDLRAVLRESGFRRLFATRLVSQFSDGVFQFAVTGYAFFSPERQTSASEAAMAFAVLLLPYSVVGPFAGVFIDRWSRRQILMIAPLVRASLLGLAAALVALDTPNELFYLVALGVLGVNRFFLSALSAGLPHVVSPERLLVANSVTPTSGTVLTFVGAGAGLLLGWALGQGDHATAVVLACSGVLYAATSLVAGTMARDLLGPDEDPERPGARDALRNVVVGLVAGARHVWSRRQASAALGAMAAGRFMFGGLTVSAVMLYRNYFSTTDAGLSGFAALAAASGAGFFAAMLVTPYATRHMSTQTWITSLLVAGAVVSGTLITTYSEIPFLVAGFLLGVCTQSVKICTDTLVQRHVDDAYLGRVFSIYDMLFNGAFVLAAAVVSLMLPQSGKSYLVVGVLVAGYALAAAVYRLWSRAPARHDSPVTAA